MGPPSPKCGLMNPLEVAISRSNDFSTAKPISRLTLLDGRGGAKGSASAKSTKLVSPSVPNGLPTSRECIQDRRPGGFGAAPGAPGLQTKSLAINSRSGGGGSNPPGPDILYTTAAPAPAIVTQQILSGAPGAAPQITRAMVVDIGRLRTTTRFSSRFESKIRKMRLQQLGPIALPQRRCRAGPRNNVAGETPTQTTVLTDPRLRCPRNYKRTRPWPISKRAAGIIPGRGGQFLYNFSKDPPSGFGKRPWGWVLDSESVLSVFKNTL
jgi:hypothetical protein